MTINERIRELRKMHLHLSAEEFGSRIGVTRSAVTNIEVGLRGVTDQMFRSIVREFDVNEDWLRNGEGEVFVPRDMDKELTDLMDRVLSEPDGSFKRKLLKVMANLTEEQWILLAEMSDKLKEEG